MKRKQQRQDLRVVAVVAELYAQYSKHALPDDELRKIIDEEMGAKTISEELRAMREER